MIVLSNGKNINPIEIETKISSMTNLISEMVVTEYNSILTAVIHPDFEKVKEEKIDNIYENLKWEVVDKYNQKAPDYKKILELFSKENINYEVLLLVSRYNENMINGYIEYFRYCNVSFKMDFIYPNPMNNHFSYKYKEFLLEYRNHIIQCTPVSIGVLLLRNPCYYNRIAVSLDGEVYPCILSRTEPYGNYRDNNMIVHLLDDKYKRFKNLNKDKYVACKTCVYRYGLSLIHI